MEFRTKIDIPTFGFDITYANRCIFVGSCFAENIGNKLVGTKIHTSVNPTGILYNPFSICKSIKNALGGMKYGEDDVFFFGWSMELLRFS